MFSQILTRLHWSLIKISYPCRKDVSGIADGSAMNKLSAQQRQTNGMNTNGWNMLPDYIPNESTAELLGIAPRTLRKYQNLLKKALKKDFPRANREKGYPYEAVEILQKFIELKRVLPEKRALEHIRVYGVED